MSCLGVCQLIFSGTQCTPSFKAFFFNCTFRIASLNYHFLYLFWSRALDFFCRSSYNPYIEHLLSIFNIWHFLLNIFPPFPLFFKNILKKNILTFTSISLMALFLCLFTLCFRLVFSSELLKFLFFP